MISKTHLTVIALLVLTFNAQVYADCCCDLQLPQQWQALKPTVSSRLSQTSPSLKLSDAELDKLLDYMEALKTPTPELQKLQIAMPQSTLELLRLLQAKKINVNDAEKIAGDLIRTMLKGQAKDQSKFDTTQALKVASQASGGK